MGDLFFFTPCNPCGVTIGSCRIPDLARSVPDCGPYSNRRTPPIRPHPPRTLWDASCWRFTPWDTTRPPKRGPEASSRGDLDAVRLFTCAPVHPVRPFTLYPCSVQVCACQVLTLRQERPKPTQIRSPHVSHDPRPDVSRTNLTIG